MPTDDRLSLRSRFATVEDVRSEPFRTLNRSFDELHVRYDLPDHSQVNALRYPWAEGTLSRPAFYAARLWEYPFSVLAAELEPGMKVADIGCGMTPFTIHLHEQCGCDVTGVDPDAFETGVRYLGHGVSREFIERTGLRIRKGDFDRIPLDSDSQDRVFCISVMEHVAADVRRRGMQEIARVLKLGGLAILTVDMSMFFELNRPLDLLWESGLALVEPVDLRWPSQRFGMFSTEGVEGLPADVFGLTLVKEDRRVDTAYRQGPGPVESVPAHLVPSVVGSHVAGPAPLWRRVAGRLSRELKRVRAS